MGIMKLLGTSFSTILNGGNPTADRTVTFPDASGEALLQGRALTLMTAQNSTSGTSIDFTGIPSWAKRITVMFNGVSTNGTSNLRLQLGDSEGIETNGYVCNATQLGSTSLATVQSTNGIDVYIGTATYTTNGKADFNLFGVATWVAIVACSNSSTAHQYLSSGSKTLSATLDRIRITTVNGTDTFDAGSINIMYEG